MEEILEKISQYNLFDNLLPGTVLGYWLTFNGYLNLKNESIAVVLILFYFLGVVISRFGSSVIGWVAKKSRLVNFVDYDLYIKAQKIDPKIDVLSQSNNTFRALLSLSVILGIVEILAYLKTFHDIPFWLFKSFFIFFLILLFSLSYRKQTQFIVNRINQVNNQDE